MNYYFISNVVDSGQMARKLSLGQLEDHTYHWQPQAMTKMIALHIKHGWIK